MNAEQFRAPSALELSLQQQRDMFAAAASDPARSYSARSSAETTVRDLDQRLARARMCRAAQLEVAEQVEREVSALRTALRDIVKAASGKSKGALFRAIERGRDCLRDHAAGLPADPGARR